MKAKAKAKSKSKVEAHVKSPIHVGNAVLIRTVTHYHVGRIASIADGFILLTDAAWVADTGRFADALKNGTVSEAEPFASPVAIAMSAIIDVTLWAGTIPLAQK